MKNFIKKIFLSKNGKLIYNLFFMIIFFSFIFLFTNLFEIENKESSQLTNFNYLYRFMITSLIAMNFYSAIPKCVALPNYLKEFDYPFLREHLIQIISRDKKFNLYNYWEIKSAYETEKSNRVERIKICKLIKELK